MDISFNYVTIIVAAIVNMGIGALWYGPVFGKKWMAMTGLTHEGMQASGMKPWKSMLAGFIMALVMAYTLAHALVYGSAYTKVVGTSAGLMVGFWNWLGFVVPVTLSSVIWEGKSWKLWILNAGYYLVVLLSMGIILANWH